MANRAKSLVKETSATTGTGSYTLAGAAAGFRRFQDAYAFGATTYMPYVARMGANYEIGIAKLSAAATLERFAVIESSNANAAVNWAVGSKDIYCSVGGNWGPQGRHNFDATVPPVFGTDHLGLGYGPGSLWYIASKGLLYVCVDATAANGFWKQAASSCVSPLAIAGFSDYSGQSVDLSSGQNICDSANQQGTVAHGEGGSFSQRNMRGVGYGFISGSTYGAFQMMDGIGFVKETINATPTFADMFAYNFNDLFLPQSCAWLLEIRVLARCDVDSDCKAWSMQALVQRTTSGDPVIIGTPTPVVIANTGGAAAWAFALGVNNAADAMTFQVTGAAAKIIRWVIDVKIVQVAEN